MALIGAVGFGKSSLLMAILGEIPVLQGTVLTKKGTEIVLAEQEPLIVTGTVRDNVLFGLPFDDAWYNEVV